MLETRKRHCPWCGEPVELVLDASVAVQEYIEDCEVCCRPMVVNVTIGEQDIEVTLARENG